MHEIKYKKGKDKENDNWLRFNLRRETKIYDLLEKFIGAQYSPSGLKIEKVLFMKSYSEVYKLVLEEIFS